MLNIDSRQSISTYVQILSTVSIYYLKFKLEHTDDGEDTVYPTTLIIPIIVGVVPSLGTQIHTYINQLFQYQWVSTSHDHLCLLKQCEKDLTITFMYEHNETNYEYINTRSLPPS